MGGRLQAFLDGLGVDSMNARPQIFTQHSECLHILEQKLLESAKHKFLRTVL